MATLLETTKQCNYYNVIYTSFIDRYMLFALNLSIKCNRYVPAYSTRLKYESETWEVLPHNSSDAMGEADPVWTESNWNTITLRVYTVQDTKFDQLVLLLGITVTVLSYLIIVISKAFITKALKRD